MKKLNILVGIIFGIFVFTTQAAIPEKPIFKDQIKIALDQQMPMSQRWIAVMKTFETASGGYENKQLEQFFVHKDWYIRNAALIAIERKSAAKAVEAAKKAVKDRALVVRSAAAEILIKSDQPDSVRILIDELNQPYNFRGKQSLWIRSQVMNYLTTKYDSIERDFFVQLLFDKDSKVAYLAMDALEKKTGEVVDASDLKKKLGAWQARAKDKKWL